jgi:hypothetical protein
MYQNISLAYKKSDQGLYSESYTLYSNAEDSLKLLINGYATYDQNLRNLLNENRQLNEKQSTTKSESRSNALLGIKYFINGVQKSSGIEGDKLCIEYGLNLYRSGYSGPSSPMISESVRVTKEIVNDYYNSVIDGPFTTWYKTDSSGMVNFCETLIVPEGYWKTTYRYSAQYPGGITAYSNAPTLSINFEQDPNNPYESEQEREQSELNEKLVKETEMKLEKQRQLEQEKKKQELAEIGKQNAIKIQKAKQEREQKALENAEIQKEIDERQTQLKNEVKYLQSQAYNNLKLTHKVDDAENMLKKVSSETTEQKEAINKAWDLLKINKEKINDMRETKTKGDNQLRSDNYLGGILHFNTVEKVAKQVDGNLDEISKIIKDVEKMKSQTCFLFWCW